MNYHCYFYLLNFLNFIIFHLLIFIIIIYFSHYYFIFIIIINYFIYYYFIFILIIIYLFPIIIIYHFINHFLIVNHYFLLNLKIHPQYFNFLPLSFFILSSPHQIPLLLPFHHLLDYNLYLILLFISLFLIFSIKFTNKNIFKIIFTFFPNQFHSFLNFFSFILKNIISINLNFLS